MDTVDKQYFVPYSEVSVTRGASGIFLIGVVLHNTAVEHNKAMFTELSLAVQWQGQSGLSELSVGVHC